MSKQLISLIPETIKSPINRVLYDNVFQPFVEKKNQQISTFNADLDREAYTINPSQDNIDANISSYQPVIKYNNELFSFYDLISLMERYNINVGLDNGFSGNGIDVWGTSNVNSLKLPINYDKFVNYIDYCWVGDNNPNYIVIRNAYVQQKETEIYNAVQANNTALADILRSQLFENINGLDPNGGFDDSNFDNYNFDSQLAVDSSLTGTNWETNNKWIHKDDIPLGVNFVKATIPIIEYSNKLSLVKWMQINHEWSYRISPVAPWTITNDSPTLNELQAGSREIVELYNYVYVNNNDKKLFIDTPLTININDIIVIKGSDLRWTVQSYTAPVGNVLGYIEIVEDNFRYFRFDVDKKFTKLVDFDVIDVTTTVLGTFLTIKGNVVSLINPTGTVTILNFFNEFSTQYEYTNVSLNSGNTVLTLSTSTNIPSNDLNGRFTSISVSSKNDEWSGFHTHWCYKGIKESIVTNDKTAQTQTATLTLTKNILGEQVDLIELGATYPNSDLLIKVYINGKRIYNYQYGNYDGINFTAIDSLYGAINSIKLNETITVTVPLIIEVFADNDAVEDIQYKQFLVRIDENEKNLQLVSLLQYQKLNQKQTRYNMYPLFKGYTLSSSPTLLTKGLQLFKHKLQNDGLYIPEIQQFVQTNNEQTVFETDLITPESVHYMYNINNEFKHVWSNVTNKQTQITFVDSNGFESTSINYDNTLKKYVKIPEYMYSNINNIVSSTHDRYTLTKHFTNILSDNNVPYRILDDVNYIDNTVSNLNIFDTSMPHIINLMTNTIVFDNVIETHKQARLMYLSIFISNIFETFSANNISNINDWYDDVYNNIVKYDSLKSFNYNYMLHPVTAAMVFGDFITEPFIVDDFLFSHDATRISFANILPLYINRLDQINGYQTNVPLTPVINDVYFDDGYFYVYDGSVWLQTEHKEIILQILLLLEQQLYQISIDLSSPNSNGVVNINHIDDIQNELFLQYAKQKQISVPFSNRPYYSLNDSFTWNYNQAVNDLSNVSSPIFGLPNITSTYWGSSYKEIYNNMFNTPYPNIEPWKLQGYNNKPTWWDGYYKDITNTRIWNVLMWSNVLDGIVPLNEALPNNTLSTGTTGETTRYNFIPVNVTGSVISGIQPDELLPPFRSIVDSLSTSVLINNISYINLDYTNYAEDVFGNGTLIEWDWKEQINSSYDELLWLFKSDPTIIFKLSNTTNINNVRFVDSQLINATKIKDYSVNRVFELYRKYCVFHNIDMESHNFDLIDASMAFLPGAYINSDQLNINEIDSDYINVLRKDNQFNIRKPVTNFKVSIQNVNNAKRSDLLHNCSFSVDSLVTDVSDVNIYKSIYTNMSIINLTDAVIDSYVYDRFITGTKIIVTWNGYVPEEFTEQDDFYVVKKGANVISLCRSITEINSNIFVNLPQQYSYDIYCGIKSDDFYVLNRQTVSQSFNVYAFDYSQIHNVTLPITVTGIQELINFMYGYIKCLQKDGITETYFNNQVENELFNRVESFQLELELLLAQIYNDKTNRNLFIGNDYVCRIFKNHIFINTDKQLLSLVHDVAHQDMSLMFDDTNNNIPTSSLLVYRTNPILVETVKPIGGAVLFLTTSQDVIVLDNEVYPLYNKGYIDKFTVTSGILQDVNGFIEISQNNFEYNFEELTNALKNINTTTKTIPVFKQLSQEQLGYQPFSNNSLYNLSEDGGFKFWKESLKSKGSNESLIPFKNTFSESINASQLISAYKYSFGQDFEYDYVPHELTNKTYALQNSVYEYNNIQLSVPLSTSDELILSKTFNNVSLLTDNLFQPINKNDYKISIDFNVVNPIIKTTIPRFTTDTFNYVISVSTDITKVQLFINNVYTTFEWVKNANSFAIECPINDSITNNITLILPTNTILDSYQYINPQSIVFDLTNIQIISEADVDFIAVLPIANNILVTNSVKNSLKKFEYFDPVSNNIPYVDFVSENDPLSNLYNVVSNIDTNITQTNIISMINKLWYKKSSYYRPYNHSYYSEDFQVKYYGQSFLNDDSVFQLIQSEIPPAVWHEIVETQPSLDINGIPKHYISKRTRVLPTDNWGSWTVLDVLHQQLITPLTSTSVNITIGELFDVCQIFINGEFFKLVVNDGSAQSLTFTSKLNVNQIDIFIQPIKKEDTDLEEYQYTYDYYKQQVNSADVFYYWVSNIKNNQLINAFSINQILKTSHVGLHGYINNKLIVFNNDFRWRNVHILHHNNKVEHDIWSIHTIDGSTNKFPLNVWEKVTKAAIETNRHITLTSIDNIWIPYTDLTNTINNILIKNNDKITPYDINDLLLTTNTPYQNFVDMYYQLSSEIINTIVASIVQSLVFDVSDTILFSSLVQLTSREDINV